MLIGDSTLNHVFIRGAILGLRLIAPASIAYCIICPIFRGRAFFNRPLSWISCWTLAESSFFLLFYLPLKLAVQREAVHPEPPPAKERNSLFSKCLRTITEPESYLSRWFLGASITDIKRESVKAFYAWSYLNKEYRNVTDAEDLELEQYVDQFEEKFDCQLQPGNGSAHGLRGTLEGVYVQHRPLIWYVIIGLVDFSCSIRLLANGYTYYRPSLQTSLNMIPLRFLSLLGRSSQPPAKISYWFRKHTAKHRLPVVFIHGVGVGMYAYMSFLTQVKQGLATPEGEGEVGIIAIEILPISARICSPALTLDEMRSEIDAILKKHGWHGFVLVGHSYGTAIASNIIRHPHFHDRVRGAVLMDPICFLLHLPDVACNFTRRLPNKASEAMLYYFSSRDMMISHTFARKFFWSQAILWREDIDRLPLTVTLSGRDIIVPINAVWNYLTDSSAAPNVSANEDGRESFQEQTKQWSNGLLDVFWFDQYNHADLFDSKGTVRGMIRVIQQYSALQSSE